jgi:hypothetical protein
VAVFAAAFSYEPHFLWEIPGLLQALQKKSTSPDGAPPNQKD